MLDLFINVPSLVMAEIAWYIRCILLVALCFSGCLAVAICIASIYLLRVNGERHRNGPNATAFPPAAVACGSVAPAITQFLQKLFCGDQIGRAETLREAVINRLKAGDGISRTALIAKKPGEACRPAKLPKQRLL